MFTNFYTNRNDNARSSNTQLSAQADSITASADEITNNSSPLQENGELFRFEEDAVSTADTFTSAAEAINIETQKSPQGSWKTIQKRMG